MHTIYTTQLATMGRPKGVKNNRQHSAGGLRLNSGGVRDNSGGARVNSTHILYLVLYSTIYGQWSAV